MNNIRNVYSKYVGTIMVIVSRIKDGKKSCYIDRKKFVIIIIL